MERRWRLGLVMLILIWCVGCDRATKHVAREELGSSPPISVLNDLVRLEYVENRGVLLGLGSSLPREGRFLLSVLLAGASVLATLGYMARAHRLDVVPLIGLSLLAGGGVGNLMDRFLNDGAVADFVRLGIGPFRTGVFNVADVAVVVGVAMVLLWSAGERKSLGVGVPDGG